MIVNFSLPILSNRNKYEEIVSASQNHKEWEINETFQYQLNICFSALKS